jgi:T-complex protein 1 subunit beta
VFGSRVRVDSAAKLAEIEEAEKLKMKQKVDKIVAHNISCFINRQLIYNYPEQVLVFERISVPLLGQIC